ncbi:odorant receptor 46a [Solenopsis invicta]|uniref:odorant receptor 46a n=1 Tax=Solenopsis invicta TaxID=13686 RepID=UPI00193C8C1F|nr:odorant receptor 46a [Solenopsis invicta]
MHVLKLTLAIFMFSGCFRPLSWTSPFKRRVYNIYRLYVISMIYFFSMAQFMDIVLNVDNPNDFTDTLNMVTTSSAACYKLFIVWFNYQKIAALINCLTEEPFKPLNLGEVEIRQQYDRIIRNNTLRYSSLIGTTCSFIALVSLFTDFRHKKLTYREWLPYDYSSYIPYCLTYAQQMICTFHVASVNVACDALLCGLLMHICCQIDILEHRLKNILSNQFTLGYCVRHHNRILEYAQVVNMRFTKIVGFQFMASTMVICSNLYQLTKSTLSANHVPLIMYTSCMLTQIFIYCWFGNKVKSKSLQLMDNIFQMEWPILDNSIKKSFLMIMKRSMIPIEISTIYILTIDLNSFVGLLKTSYSVYNLLVRVQE